MTKWEYQTFRVPTSATDENVEYYLNNIGKDSWELCSITEPDDGSKYYLFFLKRPIKRGIFK